MSSKPAKAPSRARTEGKEGTRVVSGRGRFEITFGSVTLRSPKALGKPSEETLEQSREVMRRLGDRILKPGVKLRRRKGVPEFYADETDPSLIVRELDGKRERGRFENGQFKVVA